MILKFAARQRWRARLDCIIARKPELVFLDDVLKPSDNASQTIPYLRRAEYAGPIVVVSGQVTKNRRNDLLAAGATDVIHKDDVDSVRLAEALLRVFAVWIPSTTPKAAAKSSGSKSRGSLAPRPASRWHRYCNCAARLHFGTSYHSPRILAESRDCSANCRLSCGCMSQCTNFAFILHCWSCWKAAKVQRLYRGRS